MTEDSSLIPIGDTGVTMLARGATVPLDITFPDAESAAYALVRIGAASKWAYADLLMISEHLFGEAASQLLEAQYAHPNSIANLRYTWRRFPTPESRKWDVSLSHYTSVSASYLTQEQREAILEEAERNSLSRDETRELVAAYGPHIIKVPFAKEVFIQQVGSLIDWAVKHNAPTELIEMVEVLFKEYRGEKDETYPSKEV